jgi:hypothetical protein
LQAHLATAVERDIGAFLIVSVTTTGDGLLAEDHHALGAATL